MQLVCLKTPQICLITQCSLQCFKAAGWSVRSNPTKHKKQEVFVFTPASSLIKSFTSKHLSLPQFQLKMKQTHQTHSLPRPHRSRNLSPHHISMTTRHTCWWIPRSQISLEGTSVCLWPEIKEIGRLVQCWWCFLWSHKDKNNNNNNNYKAPLDSISIAPMMQLKLIQNSSNLANWFYCLDCLKRDMQKDHEIQQRHSWL